MVHALVHDDLKVIEPLAPEERLRLFSPLRIVLLVRLPDGEADRLRDALNFIGELDARRVRSVCRVEEVVQRNGVAAAPAEAREADLRVGVRRAEVRDEAGELVYLGHVGVAKDEGDEVEDEQGWQEEPLLPCALVSMLGGGECPARQIPTYMVENRQPLKYVGKGSYTPPKRSGTTTQKSFAAYSSARMRALVRRHPKTSVPKTIIRFEFSLPVT